MTTYSVKPSGNRFQVVAKHDNGSETPIWPTKSTRYAAEKRAKELNDFNRKLGNIVLIKSGRSFREIRADRAKRGVR